MCDVIYERSLTAPLVNFKPEVTIIKKLAMLTASIVLSFILHTFSHFYHRSVNRRTDQMNRLALFDVLVSTTGAYGKYAIIAHVNINDTEIAVLTERSCPEYVK